MKTKISFFFFSSLFAISKIERIKMHSIKRESKRKKIENKQTKMKIFSAFFSVSKKSRQFSSLSLSLGPIGLDFALWSLSLTLEQTRHWIRFEKLSSSVSQWNQNEIFFQWIKILQRKISFHQLLTPPPMSLSLSFSLSGIRFLSLFSFVVEFYVWVWFLKHKFNLKLSLTKINIREKSHDWISLSFWNTFSLLPPFFLFAVDFVNFDCYFSIDSLNN